MSTTQQYSSTLQCTTTSEFSSKFDYVVNHYVSTCLLIGVDNVKMVHYDHCNKRWFDYCRSNSIILQYFCIKLSNNKVSTHVHLNGFKAAWIKFKWFLHVMYWIFQCKGDMYVITFDVFITDWMPSVLRYCCKVMSLNFVANWNAVNKP